MSLREWLIAIGTLVIIGIVIDGLRRMRRARKESMAISSGMGVNELDASPLDEDHNPELPNGGARTISRDTLEERGYLKRERSNRFGSPVQKPTRPIISDEEKRALSEPYSGNETGNPAGNDQQHDEVRESEIDDTGWGAVEDDVEYEVAEGLVSEPRTGGASQPAAEPQPQADLVASAAEARSAPPLVTSEVEEDTARREQMPKRTDQPLAGANRPEAREVIVINVLARNGEDFKGTALKNLFEACGLEYGDMDIYHRHEQSDTISPVQFSVASAVEPGTFRPADMPGMATPGISFFMSLPGPSNALQAFDFMLETAQCVVRNMGGELKDERRSVMTPQTIEHCRQRIREFERKQRSHRH
ncbi:cell division protein ZipA [Marinobacter sp. M-5]|uniref:cell division protein ZipA n=1 Tax=Marinobacter sp. M-5 TaxID=3081089 RepID=UPI00293CF6D1|nr:cell division protein ZipA [Marinobacter sp. M-5]MDV3503794.1 cell division protein ZipA [Marinobacter sp. M-5]